MGDLVRWASEPPPPRGQSGVKFFSCPERGAFLLRLLGSPVGAWQHWLQGRSLPCVGPACRVCPDPGLRWNAWLPAELWTSDKDKVGWQVVAALITRGVYWAIKPHGWRGTYVKLQRVQAGGFKELQVELAAPPAGDTTPLREAFDPMALLRETWLRRWPMLEGILGLQPAEPPAQAVEDATPPFRPVKAAEGHPKPPSGPEKATESDKPVFLAGDAISEALARARHRSSNGHQDGNGRKGGGS